jgi:hypothetical protein
MSDPSSRAIESIDSHLPKVISPTVHGIIDYTHAAFFLTLGAFCLKSNKRAAAAAFFTGGFVLVQSLLTDYRFGVKPVIPFKTHGQMDAAFAGSSWLMPHIFGFTGTAAAKVFEGNSLAESSVVAMTDWSTERAHQEREAA